MRDSLGGVDMTFRVRVYCHASFAGQACPHEPRHPFMLPEQFPSIRAANDSGGTFVDGSKDEEVEWEVLDAEGNIVC